MLFVCKKVWHFFIVSFTVPYTVIPDFIKLLVQEEWVQDHYFLSDTSGTTLGNYGTAICNANRLLNEIHFLVLGVLMMTRLPPERLSFWSLPSHMGRNILLANFVLNGQRVSARLFVYLFVYWFCR
jgi:hypothetical protein